MSKYIVQTHRHLRKGTFKKKAKAKAVAKALRSIGWRVRVRKIK